jgi:predicted ATPase/DNA-binding SARP family transcriptional activator
MSRVALFLLGPPRIERDGEPVEIDTRKAIALASYLAVSGEEHSRDALAALFWPLSDQSRARAALRRTLSTRRRALGYDRLEADGERLALSASDGFRVDVDQFLGLLATCDSHGHPPEKTCPACLAPLSEAIGLYRADFMNGFSLRDSPGFDEWQTFQTESLRLELAWALERLVRRHCDTQEFEPAIAYARRWIAIDPMHVLPNYLLMQMYTWSGQRSAALRQYHEYVEVLERELDVPPEEDITELYQALRENRTLPLPSRPATVHIHNLPLQPTPFVGREDELLQIGQLLERPSYRLVTLFGPGGIGKTRLALQVAVGQVGAFADGVYFVPLANLNSPDLLVPAIADSVGFAFHGRAEPKAQLLNYLREKEMLLLLDNFEHLLSAPALGALRREDGTPVRKEVDAPGLLVEMLSGVAGLKLMVTSRERLNLQWEWPFEVRGLPFPQTEKPAALEGFSAVQLFLQSARRAHPGFSLSEAEQPHVVRICQSLEGMPLGIELAAAWTEVSSCQRIAQEIERNLGFLITARRDVPERHRSLRAAFEHSWLLLSAEERSVLIRLSAFRGGFRRQAASTVAGASLMHLSALMHKSFLRRTAAGRYEMLEILRQHAEDKLLETPKIRDETHDRHSEFYAEFLYQRENRLQGRDLQQALDEIGEEIDNVRAAWRWMVTHRRQRSIERSLHSLYRFYETRSRFVEGEDALRQAARAVAGAGDALGEPFAATQDALLAKLLTRQGWMCLKLSRFEEGKELLQTSLATLRRLDEPAETALAVSHLGFVHILLGDFDKAAELCEESITIYSAIGDPIGMARGLNNIGIVAIIQRRYTEARLLLQESLAIREERGDLPGMMDSLTNLGLVAEALEAYDDGERFHRRCLEICKEVGDRWGIANSLCNLGFSLAALKQNAHALKCFQESLETAVDLQAVDLIIEDLIGIATLLSQEGEKLHAVELVACTLHHPAIAGKAKERAEQLLSELESQLAPQTFAAAADRGRAKDIRHYARVHGPVVLS